MRLPLGLLVFPLLLLGTALFPDRLIAADAIPPDIAALLKKLDVTLTVTERPAWPKPRGSTVDVRLVPQEQGESSCAVSFGLPFGPGVLADDGLIRVMGVDGREIPAFTQPLAHWWLDGVKGSVRSVLVQFEVSFSGNESKAVTIAWDRPRSQSRIGLTPIAETQISRRVEFPMADQETASFEYQCPKVLALLPPQWLCDSLLVWQQVPIMENRTAAWYDQHLNEQFAGSLRYISGKAFDVHLFDRPATYIKFYARSGDAKHCLAALQAGDFYIQQLSKEGFFELKPSKDHKYVYTEGSALLYLLTGDARYREAVERAVGAWKSHTHIEYRGSGFWTERHHGFGMLAHLHAYEITGGAEYYEQAGRYFTAALSLQTRPGDGKLADGSWSHSASSHSEGSGWITSPWMSAFLADAIWKYWMLSGDARCPISLAMCAKFIERHAVTKDGQGVFYLASSPGRGASRNPEVGAHNMEAIYFLAMGHYLSGGADQAFASKIDTLWPPLMRDNANRPGRRFTWRFRETSMLVWFLQQTRG